MASTRAGNTPESRRQKLTKRVVDRLVPPRSGQAFIRDTELKGFGLRITAGGAKTFIVEKRIRGKVRRLKVGRYGELTVEAARKRAQGLLGEIATGNDPVAEKKVAQALSVTLSEVFQEYLHTRKALKPRTVYDYRRVMRGYFGDWLQRPIVEISKDMVERRHARLGEDHGGAQANQGMRTLRAVLNFAAARYEDGAGRSVLAENPVRRLSQTRAWYRVERRQTVIRAHQLKAWSAGVMSLSSPVVRDYLVFLLFTGLRRQEAARLRWSDVDFQSRTLTALDTKNRQDHVLPLSNFLLELLARRRSEVTTEFVFPGDGKSGHLVEPRKQRLKAAAASGVPFTLHDLRRTFTTVAESLDIPAYALKRLLNHKMAADVTAGYIVADVERLREPMQKITDYLRSAMGIKDVAQVLSHPASYKERASDGD